MRQTVQRLWLIRSSPADLEIFLKKGLANRFASPFLCDKPEQTDPSRFSSPSVRTVYRLRSGMPLLLRHQFGVTAMAGFKILKAGTLATAATVLALSSLAPHAFARPADEDGARRPAWSHGDGSSRGEARNSDANRNYSRVRNTDERGWSRDGTFNGRQVTPKTAEPQATQRWSDRNDTARRMGRAPDNRVQRDDANTVTWSQRSEARPERREGTSTRIGREANQRFEHNPTRTAPDRTTYRSWSREREASGRDRWTSTDRDRERRWSGSDYRRWDRDWRRDTRYDWRSYRNTHRHYYRLERYTPPYRHYGYSRLSIGFVLDSLFFGRDYWISDPWQYRLPQVYGPYRWVRYYDDVLLVNIHNGEVVDAIHDFFW